MNILVYAVYITWDTSQTSKVYKSSDSLGFCEGRLVWAIPKSDLLMPHTTKNYSARRFRITYHVFYISVTSLHHAGSDLDKHVRISKNCLLAFAFSNWMLVFKNLWAAARISVLPSVPSVPSVPSLAVGSSCPPRLVCWPAPTRVHISLFSSQCS